MGLGNPLTNKSPCGQRGEREMGGGDVRIKELGRWAAKWIYEKRTKWESPRENSFHASVPGREHGRINRGLVA
jgi:hypothetical protein